MHSMPQILTPQKTSKNFEKRFDKLRNCDILNITPQFAKRIGGVEIKKVSKKFEIKYDKLKTCAKLNITPQFVAKRNGEVDKRSRCDLESCLKIE